ncbi:glyoxalase/bleomycin resistance protein/dioxygenase [Janibacter hoylei PVAS-1]|uniref:Glyoxalase/bleomycin resistance protein/dioxygenase n=1 Tax=Janibacter hoylei PVAS-1 TaxID=1210046 RepID=K1E1Y3_9MICO|nr:VOC family protein [Janibacter hoylei]EKA62684.1 glyoxalase/bleomycin resistance protein/dioxygenase [Janibacter hoylei PVAS-1]
MDQRISLVTLAVGDLAASRRFYLDGLGWRAELDVPDEVLMIRAGERLILSLWDAAEFEGEVGPLRRGEAWRRSPWRTTSPDPRRSTRSSP